MKSRFTLLELLVVVAIIAVLAALLLPALNQARGKALTVQCGANVRQFLIALISYADDDRGHLPPHQQSNLVPDGMMMPTYHEFVRGGYFPNPRALLCGTAPLRDYPWKYSASTDASKNAGSWARFHNPTGGIDQSKASNAPNNLHNPSYNNPMGTYYYWGGGEYRIPGTNGNETWVSHRGDSATVHYSMQITEVGRPAAYAVIWDQDRFRNYLHERPGQMPHERFQPGRNFGFLDGHVTFVPMTGTAADEAHFHTPVMTNSYTIRYRGANYSQTTHAAGTDGILLLRGQRVDAY